MKPKQIISTILIALLGGIIAVFAYTKFFQEDKTPVITERVVQPVGLASLDGEENENLTDFTYAAERSVHAVVHVRTERMRDSYRDPIFEFFYGDKYSNPEPVTGIGSGVIVSRDGYIVTNNHVIENSDRIIVTLNNKREYEAKIIGADPSTDIALIKIDVEDITFIPYGDSDNLKIGEWVLAVGNPFNLTSTVTAGIVSAKGKNLGIIKDQYRMESFIQTDAAVNRGNSGGALVDLRGRLIGINTAIISPSGGYAGISFAIPVSIVKKVVSDLIEYGIVQRAILGVSITDITASLAREEGIDKIEGVYITDVRDDGGAKEAGIKAGDIILEINGIKVNSSGELQEQINRYRPNDKVDVLIKRNNKTKHFKVILRNLQGSTSYIEPGSYHSILGARFEETNPALKEKLGIKFGVQVAELRAGKLRKEGVREGFIITQINNNPVRSVDDIEQIISNHKGGIYIEGIYPNGVIAYYAFGL